MQELNAYVHANFATPTKIDIFRKAIVAGRLDVCRWVHEKSIATPVAILDARADDNWALRHAAVNGHLAVCQWLHATFQLTPEDARADDTWTLRGAASYGHLAVCEWLHATYFRTCGNTDARAKNNYALRWAAAGGHLGVCQWLYATYSLTSADVRAKYDYALRMAAARGHLAVCQWLASVGVELLDARDERGRAGLRPRARDPPLRLLMGDSNINIYQILYCGVVGNNLDVCKWLHATFKPPPHNYGRDYLWRALREAARNGDLAACKWLHTTFEFTRRKETSGAMKAAAENGHRDVCEWLHATYGIRRARVTPRCRLE